MKPSERIRNMADHDFATTDPGWEEHLSLRYQAARISAICTYLDEQHEQRQGAPELWTVSETMPSGKVELIGCYAAREEAEREIVVMSALDKPARVRGSFRLARFVGERVGDG